MMALPLVWSRNRVIDQPQVLAEGRELQSMRGRKGGARLPPSAPLITAANAYLFKDIIGGLVLAFLAALAAQFRLIHKQDRNA